MTIGENIKKARESAGMTQKELAEKLGIKAGTISAFEKDRTNIKHSTAKKISDALEIPLSMILKDSEDILNDFVAHPEEWEDVSHKYTSNKQVLLNKYFSDLNAVGKDEAVKRVEELTHIEKYTEDEEE